MRCLGKSLSEGLERGNPDIIWTLASIVGSRPVAGRKGGRDDLEMTIPSLVEMGPPAFESEAIGWRLMLIRQFLEWPSRSDGRGIIGVSNTSMMHLHNASIEQQTSKEWMIIGSYWPGGYDPLVKPRLEPMSSHPDVFFWT